MTFIMAAASVLKARSTLNHTGQSGTVGRFCNCGAYYCMSAGYGMLSKI